MIHRAVFASFVLLSRCDHTVVVVPVEIVFWEFSERLVILLLDLDVNGLLVAYLVTLANVDVTLLVRYLVLYVRVVVLVVL